MCALLALTTLSTAGVVPRGWADPGPSASDVAKAKQNVQLRALVVGRIKAKLAQADGELDKLATAAEVAVERYNGQNVKLERAKQDYATAQQRLAQAQSNFQQTRSAVAAFAAQAYRMDGGFAGPGGLGAAIGGPGGPQAFLDRESMVRILADRQASAIQRMQAARQIADMFRHQAADALQIQQALAKAAATAKQTAEDAMARQRNAVQTIEAEKAELVQQLGAAQAKADDLARRRAAALEAVREEAAAKAAGGIAAVAGLARGAGLGAIAVRAALAWLGTPYSWGGGDARGPTYGVAQGSGIRGFDCSGLMLYAWSKAGIPLDHWTGTQWTSGPHIPLSLLRPGDLVFFATDTNNPDTIHHVGMYIGQGQMIEAPYTGARVRISTIWRSGLIGATRPMA